MFVGAAHAAAVPAFAISITLLAVRNKKFPICCIFSVGQTDLVAILP